MPCLEEMGRKEAGPMGPRRQSHESLASFLCFLPPSVLLSLICLWEFPGELVTRCCFQAGTGMGSGGSHTLGWTITEGRWDTGAGYKGVILGEGRAGRSTGCAG